MGEHLPLLRACAWVTFMYLRRPAGLLVCLLITLFGGGIVRAFPLPPLRGQPGSRHVLAHIVGAAIAFGGMLTPLVLSEGSRARPAYAAGALFLLTSPFEHDHGRWHLPALGNIHGAMEWTTVGSFYLGLLRASGRCFESKGSPMPAGASSRKGADDKQVKNTRLPCHFHAQGKCTKGSACPYFHGFEPGDNTFAAQIRQTAEPCRFFARGVCSRGTKCTFSHDLTHQPIQESRYSGGLDARQFELQRPIWGPSSPVQESRYS